MKDADILYLRQLLLAWYLEYHRDLPWRRTKNPYHIWVSEVMLQQTQVNTVLPYYRNFLKQFPSLQKLACANLRTVLKAWEGMGYYARARHLHQAAKVVQTEYRGEIPSSRADFQKLPGVGNYIAAAVLSIAFDQAHAVVDGNVKRVVARLFLIDDPVNKSSSNKIFADMAHKLLDEHNPGTFNQAVMELGATVCRPQQPACPVCPLKSLCRAYQTDKTSQYPKRVPRRSVPEYHIAIGVVFRNQQVLITQRKPEGLLGGLWEFPGGKIRQGETAAAACSREIKEEVNLTVKADKHLARVKHAYTHFKIIMEVFCCNYVCGEVKLNGPAAYRWIGLDEIDSYPIPRANHKFIPQLKRMALQ